MNRKIWKALGIAVCMLALAAPRAMAETRMYNVTNEAVFNAVVQTINNDPNVSANDKNVIVLCTSIPLTGNYTLYNGKKTTIEGEGNTITVNPGAGITVTGKGTVLNLGADGYDQKLTIERNTGFAAITVSGGATANMYEHVTLQDLDRQSTVNACVKLEGNSVFNMHGGVIQNCKSQYSGGLYADKSTVTISGGTISGCEGNLGGGLYAKNSSTIEISGGEISRCTAGTGGGLYAKYSSKITINKGTISECSASEGGGLYVTDSTLNIEGGTISGCTASGAGMGGGLCAYNSIITIGGGTIEKNRAVYGGGVALIGSTINPITHWTVKGNKADNTGGGIYLDMSMNVSDGSNKIYNNTADGHGADICLEKGASITLPDAAGMGATFGDSGINIDGWYKDKPRYDPSKDVDPVDVSETLTNPRSLVASYKADPVRIEIDANGGKGGSSSQTVQKGTNVTLEAPTKEGHLFKGWKDEKGNSYPAGEDGKVKITVTGAMTLTAAWEARTFTVTYVLLDGKTRTETAAYGQNVTLGEEPRTGYTFVGWKDGEKVYQAGETITVTGDMTLTAEWKKLPSAENLPKTGDESPVLLWGAALAVSAAACFMLRRRK